MKKKIFSCKSMIHRSIPLNNLNYYNLIIWVKPKWRCMDFEKSVKFVA